MPLLGSDTPAASVTGAEEWAQRFMERTTHGERKQNYHHDHKQDQELHENLNVLESTRAPNTSFFSSRLNSTTFLIIEDDSFGEEPHIYVKVYPQVLFLSDTGCNSPRRKNLTLTSLRDYLETYPIVSNDNKPLNPGGKKEYLIICTHCHYDHIGGIEQFTDSHSTILASSHSKSFLLNDLPTHSLCKYAPMRTPEYTINDWARHLSYLSHTTKTNPPSNIHLRIQLLHVPGHTPDSLAWYDIDEHHLYVGDIFYSRKRSEIAPDLPSKPGYVPGLPGTQAAIIFPEHGNWIAYMASLALLFEFVIRENEVLRRQHKSQNPNTDPEAQGAPRVLVGSGHLSANEDAESMISDVMTLFVLIIEKAIPVVRSGVKRGVVYDFWQDGEDAAYSVLAPRRLVEEARKAMG